MFQSPWPLENHGTEIVVHNDDIRVPEDDAQGSTFHISLSRAVEPGKTVTIGLSRVASPSSGEGLQVLGNNSVTFDPSNWNQQKALTIRSTENNSDTSSQEISFIP